MTVVKRIGPFSLAKILCLLYGCIGLIIGGILALLTLVGAGLATLESGSEPAPAWFAAIFGFGAVIFLPLFYGTLGFVLGAISAALYNFFAGIVGGIEVDLEP